MLGQELCRCLCARVALPLRPRLDLTYELAQLAEQHAGLGVRTVERLDALESCEHRACLFHADDATAACVSTRAQLCNAFRAKQRRVKLAQQCAPVTVEEHGDEQAADEIRSRFAHGVDELRALLRCLTE